VTENQSQNVFNKPFAQILSAFPEPDQKSKALIGD
jgi:hypothetical protein